MNYSTSPEAPGGLHIRAAAFQPVRTAHVRDVVQERLRLDPAGLRALVVGSGHGLLTRELARLGFVVTGVDPDTSAVESARKAADEGLTVHYEVGDPTALSQPDGSFDLAYYADTLEVTDDLDGVLAEAARVLGAGAALLYDTVNRTLLSRIIYLGLLQSWPWTRVMPRHQYAGDRLRPPRDLAATLADHGMRNQYVRGFLPASPRRLLQATLQARRGEIGDAEAAELAGMHLAPEGKVGPVTYVGYAVKQS